MEYRPSGVDADRRVIPHDQERDEHVLYHVCVRHHKLASPVALTGSEFGLDEPGLHRIIEIPHEHPAHR